MTEKRSREESVLNYIISFFVYSIFLWLYRFLFSWITNPKSVDFGILYGPYAPYMALCIMFVMLLFGLIKKYGKKKDINPTPILLIIMSVIILGALEFLGSFIYECIFKTVPWNYSGMRTNIGGRVSLLNTVILSVFELIIVYIAQPFLNKTLDKLGYSTRIIISMAIVTILLTDIVCTALK